MTTPHAETDLEYVTRHRDDLVKHNMQLRQDRDNLETALTELIYLVGQQSISMPISTAGVLSEGINRATNVLFRVHGGAPRKFTYQVPHVQDFGRHESHKYQQIVREIADPVLGHGDNDLHQETPPRPAAPDPVVE
jgi:hypothetical protein